MQFNSLLFVGFFAFVLFLHSLPLSWRTRKLNLLWLSYVFYAAWDPPFVVLLWISTLADWFIARWLHRSESPVRRRLLLLLSLFVNLGMLAYFKYAAFAVENFAALLNLVGIDWHPLAPDLAVPFGISFYTFQTLSYTIDIYSGRSRPWHSFFDYALFVTFFPQLVAGPIVRARQFLPQCVSPPRVTRSQLSWGLYLFVLGVFEKTVLADGIFAPTVEAIFDPSAPPTGVDGWVGGMAFMCQVFCDFAGYSTAAIGLALCLGFRLPMNFRFPLAAVGFIDLWKRWHISLSTWLRDYVYLPLGGNRVALPRWVFNLLFTWTLIGLWHGASWSYVLWGTINGLFIVVERLLYLTVPRSRFWTRTPVQFCFAVIQFLGFSLACLAFRAPTMDRLAALARPMFAGSPSDRAMLLSRGDVFLTAGTMLALFLCHWFMRASSLEELARRTPWLLRAVVLGAMLVLIVVVREGDRAFVYFQF